LGTLIIPVTYLLTYLLTYAGTIASLFRWCLSRHLVISAAAPQRQLLHQQCTYRT